MDADAGSQTRLARAQGVDGRSLTDQQLAGLIMWIPTCVIFILFGVALLAAWLGESERRARLGSVASVER